MRTSKHAWAYLALLVTSALLLLLVRREADFDEEYRRLLELTDGPLQGRWYPIVVGLTLQGDSVCIGNGGDTPQFVFFFTGSCPSCAEALRAWSPIVDSLQRVGRIRALGIALDADSAGVAEFLESGGASMPIVQLSHPRWRDLFRVRTVPMMVILDQDGRVRASRGGSPSEALVRDSILERLDQLRPADPPIPRSADCVEP